MKKCAECGFEGKWLTHLCQGPPDSQMKDNGDGTVSVFWFSLYPAQVIDLDEVRERRFGLEKVPG